MSNKDLFPSVVDENVRQALLQNILQLSVLIPTLWTFFETLKYLEPCCDALKQIIGNNMKSTIRSSLMGSYFPRESVIIQTSEHHEVAYVRDSPPRIAAQIAYVQLWAFCARHFDGLTSFTPKKENKKTKPVATAPNPALFQHLARFAIAQGFKLPNAVKLASEDSQRTLALEYLQKANPTSTSIHSDLIQKVVSVAVRPAEDHENGEDEEEAGYLPVERRCGRPFEYDYLNHDRRSMFLPCIYGSHSYSEVTINFVRHDLFTHIFGPFKIQVSTFAVKSLHNLLTFTRTEISNILSRLLPGD
jgi:hypothetical protein